MCTCHCMLRWRSGKQHCEVGSLPLYVAWAWVLGFEWQMLSPWALSQCPPHPIFSWTFFITFDGKPSTIWYIIFPASELKNESHRKEKSGFFTQTQHVLCFDADVGRRGVGSEGNSCYPRRLGIDFWCCRPSSLPSTKALADVGDVSSWSLTVTGCTGTFSLSGFCSVQVSYSYFIFVYVALAGLNLIIDLSPLLLHLPPYTYVSFVVDNLRCLSCQRWSLPVYALRMFWGSYIMSVPFICRAVFPETDSLIRTSKYTTPAIDSPGSSRPGKAGLEGGVQEQFWCVEISVFHKLHAALLIIERSIFVYMKQEYPKAALLSSSLAFLKVHVSCIMTPSIPPFL